MYSFTTWCRYLAHKSYYSLYLTMKSMQSHQEARLRVSNRALGEAFWKNMMQEKLTFLHWINGEEMAPTIGEQGGTLLVRKIPTRLWVGDVVVVKEPKSLGSYLVRRLSAIEGYKMVSTDEKDEPFVLEKDHGWVTADNEALKPKDAKDSRTFGPVPMTSIVGRVIYCLRTAVDHGPVKNNPNSMRFDRPILEVELDVEEMAKNHKP